MMGYDLHTYLRGLLDVTNDDVELAIAFGTLGKPDIVVVHSYGFEGHAGFIAIVLHLLQLIGIPGAVGLTFRICAVRCLTPWRRLYSKFAFAVISAPGPPATLW